jgi:hypothetical protein
VGAPVFNRSRAPRDRLINKRSTPSTPGLLTDALTLEGFDPGKLSEFGNRRDRKLVGVEGVDPIRRIMA